MGTIRFLLAGSVVLAHSTSFFGIRLTGGRTAVECFFVISGFYMAMVLEGKYSKVSRGPWRTFVLARLYRLFPMYLVIVALTVVAAGAGVPIYVGGGTQDLAGIVSLDLGAAALAVFSNTFVLGQDAFMWLGGTADGTLTWTSHFYDEPLPAYRFLAVPQAWSVSLELMFYMAAPWLARRRVRTLIVIVVGSLACRGLLLAAGYANDPWSYRFFPSELSLFLAGMIAYKVCRSRRPSGIWTSSALPLGVAASLVAFQGAGANQFAMLLFPFAFAAVVPALFQCTRESRVDRWIGDLSYPLYLVHILVLAVIVRCGLPINGPVLIAFSTVAAVALMKLVDRPVEAARQRFIGARSEVTVAPYIPRARSRSFTPMAERPFFALDASLASPPSADNGPCDASRGRQ